MPITSDGCRQESMLTFVDFNIIYGTLISPTGLFMNPEFHQRPHRRSDQAQHFDSGDRLRTFFITSADHLTVASTFNAVADTCMLHSS